MKINWSIKNLERRKSDGYVVKAFWTATTTDNDLSTNISGCCIWPNGEIETAYEALSEQQVLDWIWNTHVDKESVENSLMDKIENIKSPIFLNGKPWQDAQGADDVQTSTQE